MKIIKIIPLKKENKRKKKENKFRKEDCIMPRDVLFLEYEYKKNNDYSKTLRRLEVEEPNKSVVVSDVQRN